MGHFHIGGLLTNLTFRCEVDVHERIVNSVGDDKAVATHDSLMGSMSVWENSQRGQMLEGAQKPHQGAACRTGLD